MNLNDYQSLARRTSAFNNASAQSNEHITMAILGLCGEVGELADLFKKYQYHNHALDMNKIKLELGDIAWYLAEACTAFGFTLDEVCSANIEKLKRRYGDKFSSDKSINRSG